VSRLVSRRVVGPFAALVIGVAIAFPLGVIASHQFSDVPNTNTYHADIDALADAGVTTGCGDGTTFCPSAFVTREQMAAFMNRLGALGPGKAPVVNADKVDGFHAADLHRVAFNAVGVLINGSLAPTTGTVSTQINLPAPGFLIVSGNTTLYSPSTVGNSTCQLQYQGGGAMSGSYHQTSTGSPGVTNQCTSQTVATTCTAGTLTLEFYVVAGTGDTSAQDASIIVQYVPFDATGLPPSCGG
jgi:hypothetical protein